MKKYKFIFILMSLFLFSGCGVKNNSNDVLEKFEKKVNSVKSYNIKGTMEITSNEETYTYDVNVDYLFEDKYKVTLTNKVNGHEQVILKNDEGVYVVTPALNKSFKFQSDWPNNSSQSYLLSSLVRDIKNTKDIKIDTNDDYIIANVNVNYPNNPNLASEKIYFDKNNNLKEVQVLNKDGNAIIRMKFGEINYSKKMDVNNFSLDTLITQNDCKGEENCTSLEKTEESINILDNIVYPLYVPQDTHLSTKDTVSTDNGDRVIMTYAGAKPFMIIEEAVTVNKDMEITSVYGDPLLLSTAIGALSSNSLEWQSNNVQYYITSSYLTGEELMSIAESLNTAAVVDITNK